MNFITNLENKKIVYIFIGASVFNLLISFLIYYFVQFNKIKNEASQIANFFTKVIAEKNIEIKIKKDDIDLNASEYLIENKDFPININSKNLLYISKNANYGDFNAKETLAIMNSKELVLKMDGEYQNFALANLIGDRQEAQINKDTVKGYIDSLGLENNGFLYSLLGALAIERIIFYTIEFFWGYFILTLALFYLLKFSGYVYEKENIRKIATLYYALFVVLEVAISFFRLPVNFIHVFVLGFLGIGLYLKFSLDKKEKTA